MHSTLSVLRLEWLIFQVWDVLFREDGTLPDRHIFNNFRGFISKRTHLKADNGFQQQL